MKVKKHTTAKWFETETHVEKTLRIIYLLVDCYFQSRGNEAMCNKHVHHNVCAARKAGYIELSEFCRLKITAKGKQFLREHRLTRVEHHDFKIDYDWMVAA